MRKDNECGGVGSRLDNGTKRKGTSKSTPFFLFTFQMGEKKAKLGWGLFIRLPFVVVLNQCNSWLASLEFILLYIIIGKVKRKFN